MEEKINVIREVGGIQVSGREDGMDWAWEEVQSQAFIHQASCRGREMVRGTEMRRADVGGGSGREEEKKRKPSARRTLQQDNEEVPLCHTQH